MRTDSHLSSIYPFKEHWNSIASDGSVPDDEIREMVDHSYTLVVKSLTKVQRQTLENS